MKRRLNWRYALGAALVAAVAAVILLAFALMSRAGVKEQYLADKPDERYGWSYELFDGSRTRPYEPEFAPDGYLPELPDGIEAVRIRRTMTEDIPNAELEWHSYRDGVEVFLDGELLYTDFRTDVQRGPDGFLRPEAGDWDRIYRSQGDAWNRMRMSLPADYLGKELCVVTYFPEDWGIPAPEYPFLGNDDSYAASFVVPSVKYDAAMTVYALLALLIAAVFLMDIPNDGADARTALLSVYFLLLFLIRATESYAGYYSELCARLNLSLLYELYVVPLYLYLALSLRKRWRIPLCGAIVAWTLYECVRWFLNSRRVPAGNAQIIGPWALAVFLAVAVACCADGVARARSAHRNKRRMTAYAIAGAVIIAAHMLGKFRAWGSARAYLVNGIWTALRVGSFEPVVSLVTDIASAMALIAVVSEFVRRTLRHRQEMSVLQDRTRQTMEGYERLLAAESATNALHHEMRHHMIAISGILEVGDIERARRYADAIAGDLDRLPSGRYSPNLLVDVIAGSYLDRAWARGIRVEHQLNVPPELDIADEDLSVFLSNMLQNALEACERMDAGAERYIRVEMRLRGKFLFIHCANSAAQEDHAGRDRPGHGYGLAAMRKVAEKYNSAVVIEREPGEFSIMSDLCLRAS